MAHRLNAGEVLYGPKTPVWGCSCGESTNWASWVKCKACGKAAPQTIIDKAKAASKRAQVNAPEPTVRRPVAEGKDWSQVIERLKKLEKGAFHSKQADTRACAPSAPRGQSQSRERGRSKSRRVAPAGAPQGDRYVVVRKKRRHKSATAQAAAPASTQDREMQALKRKLAETEKRAADAEKRAKAAPDATSTAVGPADAPMTEEGWDCALCGADQTRSKKKACRICAQPRVTGCTPDDAPSTRSPEEITVERAVLHKRKETLCTYGFKPALLADNP